MLVALSVALFASTALANWSEHHQWRHKTHTVRVGGSYLQYEPSYVHAKPGEKIRFVFLQKNHTATQSSFEEPCRPLLGQFGEPAGFDSGFQPSQGEANAPEYTIEVHNDRPIWVYCRQRGPERTHCQSGMVFAVNPPQHGERTFEAFKRAATQSTAQNNPSWSVSAPQPHQTGHPSYGHSSSGWHKPGGEQGNEWWDTNNGNSSHNGGKNGGNHGGNRWDTPGGSYASHPGGDDEDGEAAEAGDGDDYGTDAPYGSTTAQYYPTTTTTHASPTYSSPANPGTTHYVDVGGLKPDGTPDLTFRPNYVHARPGDYVQFKFGAANHTATVGGFADPCRREVTEFDSGFMPVAAAAGVELVSGFTVRDTRPIWMYCRQPGAGARTHCQQGMVFAVNPPPQGNTFEKFLENAAASTSQTSGAPANGAPASGAPSGSPPTTGGQGQLSALGALSSEEESSSLNKLVSYGPIVIGLLGGAVGLGLILVIMTAMLLIKARRGDGARGRSFSPSYAPVKISGPGASKPSEKAAPLAQEESYEYSTPSGRYSDQ